jgi:hypothetical protein
LSGTHLLTLKNVAEGGVEPIQIIRNWEKILEE